MTETRVTSLSRRRNRTRAGAVALLAILGGSLGYMGPAVAQAPPFPTFELLAAGFSPERHLRLRVKGPSDILQLKIVGRPGDDTGWHTHPGPAVAVVQTGAVTFYRANGCVSVHPAGSVVFEAPGEVHRVVNEGAVTTEIYATAIMPHGTQLFEPAADPGPRTCRPHHGRDDDLDDRTDDRD